jgi:riboflavin transporter FmnP
MAWLDNPARLADVRKVALVPVLSALIVGSDFALAPYPDVKLLDVVVFLTAFLFGFRLGGVVAIVSEGVWSFVSPWGTAGVLMPFLVGGELFFAAAGWWASKVWSDRSKAAQNSVFIAALMLICAFAWDFETNLATALVVSWPTTTLPIVLAWQVSGIPFALIHETADFGLGLLFAPAAILLIPRVLGRKG